MLYKQVVVRHVTVVSLTQSLQVTVFTTGISQRLVPRDIKNVQTFILAGNVPLRDVAWPAAAVSVRRSVLKERGLIAMVMTGTICTHVRVVSFSMPMARHVMGDAARIWHVCRHMHGRGGAGSCQMAAVLMDMSSMANRVILCSLAVAWNVKVVIRIQLIDDDIRMVICRRVLQGMLATWTKTTAVVRLAQLEKNQPIKNTVGTVQVGTLITAPVNVARQCHRPQHHRRRTPKLSTPKLAVVSLDRMKFGMWGVPKAKAWRRVTKQYCRTAVATIISLTCMVVILIVVVRAPVVVLAFAAIVFRLTTCMETSKRTFHGGGVLCITTGGERNSAVTQGVLCI